MEKKRYYISVQADTILAGQGEAAYEFEIDATPEQIEKLQELFEDKSDSADGTFLKAHTPAIPYHHDVENDAYDNYLREIYSMIHELGTPETRRHIEEMGVLRPDN
jgi:hypothetical protein